MTRLVIDPVTRVEGHLRIELEVEAATIVRARSSGTSFRGIENVLRGRDPREAPHITQRICGVCPIPHARVACEAFENAIALTVSPQATWIRNIVQAANFIDSHLLHFYLLALPDFVSGLPMSSSAQLAPSPKVRDGGRGLDGKLLSRHVELSLRIRRACHEIIVALAGKMPHAPGIVPGGATVVPTAALLADLTQRCAEIQAFVDGAYALDVQALSDAFPAYLDLGASNAILLAFGAFPDDDGRLLLPAGTSGPDGNKPSVDSASITESTANARYALVPPVHPAAGASAPLLDRGEAYSWIKVPRLAGQPCEVGPLARAVLAGRDAGHRGVMGRHLARQSEASLLAAAIATWLSRLQPAVTALPAFPSPPALGNGIGLSEGPRGALGHWLAIADSVVQHYAVVSPTTWNASPRDEQGIPGPIERSLEGVPLADPTVPIEALRIVHSFDPCLQCAVH